MPCVHQNGNAGEKNIVCGPDFVSLGMGKLKLHPIMFQVLKARVLVESSRGHASEAVGAKAVAFFLGESVTDAPDGLEQGSRGNRCIVLGWGRKHIFIRNGERPDFQEEFHGLPGSGTIWSRNMFILAAGMHHSAAFRSISSHSASHISRAQHHIGSQAQGDTGLQRPSFLEFFQSFQ